MHACSTLTFHPRTRQALIESVNWKKCNVRCVYEASNITEARKLLLEHKIDVLICDIEIVIEEIRENLERVQAHLQKVEDTFLSFNRQLQGSGNNDSSQEFPWD
jgi:DNA-binding NarL/FixJ family response regulator